MKRGIGNEKGYILLLTFVVLIGLSGIVIAFLTMFSNEMKRIGTELQDMQAFYLAEAGHAKARWALTTGGEIVGWGETREPFGPDKGAYVVTTGYSDPPTNQYITIVSEGYIPEYSATPIAKRRVVESSIPLIGSNLSLGSVATASSWQGSMTADKAIDGDSNSKWKSNVSSAWSWLNIDLGSAETFNRVVIICSSVDAYSLQYSNNGSSWTLITSAGVPPPAAPITFNKITARYVRLNVLGNRPEVNELEVYSAFGEGKFVTSL